MKTTVTSIFFYLLIAFAIWTSNNLWPLLALLFSPIVFDALDKNKDDDDEMSDTKQLNS